MAIRATVFKANLQIADMQRHYYAEHALTISQEPSETDERMMVRLLAFAIHAKEYLTFGQSMTNDEEADIWQKDLTGAIDLWIDVGLPEERLIRKACGRAKQVVVYCYGGRTAQMWYEQNSKDFARQNNLTIINIPQESTRAIALMAQKNMQLQCNIQDDEVWLMDEKNTVTINCEIYKSSSDKHY
ncbi:MAG: YaeQ family protein [Methylophilaceae bacterium]|nr:YaeQ family protein [Methylophilaceae bacterium]